jgi:phosphohistidine swiveling domain-containing protein
MRSQPNNFISHKTSFRKINQRDLGGKGWNLFQLKRSGFPVPPWCVVSSRVFDQLLTPKRDRIESILNDIDFADQNDIDDASSWIARLILGSELPEEFSIELAATLGRMFEKRGLLSVRSSVIGEDSKDNSFAGQMDSFLNVLPAQVAEAIKKVWASAFSSRALIYRHQKGISLTEVSAAVIIQEMVQSAASGILFTRNPETRAKECLITAGFGLGQGVVADMVETDTYRIDWESQNVSKDVRSKESRVVLGTAIRGGARLQSVPAEKKMQQVLTDRQIRQLRDMGVKAEKSLRSPQDIEWALDQRGELFILQARPIVFAPGKTPKPTVRIWDNSNIVESYPGLTLPLSFSFARANYESIFRNATFGFLLFKKELESQNTIFKNMIGLLDGRIYYNLLNWYRMLSYLPGFKRHKDSWDQMIGISHKMPFPGNRLSLVNRLASWLIVAWKLLSIRRNVGRFFNRFNLVYDQFKDTDVSSAAEDQVIAIYENLKRELMGKWHLTLYTDFCAMKYYDWLKQLCTRWGLDRYPNLHNNLLCGEKDVESVKPVRSLVRLAETFRKDPDYQALIGQEDDQTIWNRIQDESTFADLKSGIQAHLRLFGDRGPEELKLEKLAYREEPAALIGLIKNYHLQGLSVDGMQRQEQENRRSAEKIIRRHLKNPFKRLTFRFVLKNARLAIAGRENMRFARTRLYGIVRRLFRRLGDLFEQKGLLVSASDIHYLTVEEVFGFVQGTSVTRNLKAPVELRKGEYREYACRHLKQRMETRGIPYLNSLCQVETDKWTGNTLTGIGCSSGTAEGTARVVYTPDSKVQAGRDILVAESTDPGWVFLMISSKGIVVEKGSVLSHTAIIGRELGIPTIVGVKDATRLIRDGARISINASKGEVRWL